MKNQKAEKKIERPEVTQDNEKQKPKSQPNHKGYWDKVKPLDDSNKAPVID